MTVKKDVPDLKDLGKKEEETKAPVTPAKKDDVDTTDEKAPSTPGVITDQQTGPVVTDGVHTPNVEEGKINVINKTPASLAAETPEETKQRYNISDEVPDDVHNDPNVTISRDNRIVQVASGTHLHPDVAKDTYNSSLGVPSEQAVVSTSITRNVFAGPAEVDDKGFPEERKVEALKDDTK